MSYCRFVINISNNTGNRLRGQLKNRGTIDELLEEEKTNDGK